MLHARGQSGEKSTLRMTAELDDLIRRVAARLPGDDQGNDSTVIRRVCIGIERGRVVEQKELPEILYKSGPVVKNYAFALPDMPSGEFRRIVALRLTEELENRPRKRRLPPEVRYLSMEEQEDGSIVGVWDKKYVKRMIGK